MKIALICTEKLPVPPVAGGAIQMYIDGILPYLSPHHDITVCCVQHPSLPTEEIRENIRYIRVPGKSQSVYIQKVIESIAASVEKDGSPYELIHVFNRPKFLLELSERFPGSRFSLSLHNEMMHAEKISDEAGLECIERSEFINTVSRYIAGTVTSRFPTAAEKVRVVYSGVDPKKYDPPWTGTGAAKKLEMKSKYNLQDYRVILYVGRLSIKKGVHILIDAMEKVMRTHPDTALVIAGSKWYGSNAGDEYTDHIRKLVLKLPGPVVFTGFIPPSDIADYYCMGDVFVCASQWNEPLARVHYEAMAAGIPIITTNRGGNAEVMRRTDAAVGTGTASVKAGAAADSAGTAAGTTAGTAAGMAAGSSGAATGTVAGTVTGSAAGISGMTASIISGSAAGISGKTASIISGSAAGTATLAVYPAGSAESCGIVIDRYNDPTVMADKIRFLLDNPGIATAMGRKGRQMAEEKFNWERVANEIFGSIGKNAPQVTHLKQPQISVPYQQQSSVSIQPQINEQDPLQQDLPQIGQSQMGLSQIGMPQQGMPQQGIPQQGIPQQGIPQKESTPAESRSTSLEPPDPGMVKQDTSCISIIGTGYVGLVTGACLASTGRNVVCCDQDRKKIKDLRRGIIPIYEPSLKELIDSGIKDHKLSFTDDIKQAVGHSDVIFITVGTPSLPDGSCDTSNVFEAARIIGTCMDRYKIIVVKSTVPAGTGKTVRQVISAMLATRNLKIGFDVVSNPEFLREGSAVHDFMNPDRIVIGAESNSAADALKDIYSRQIAEDIPILVTGIETAEMIKYASNAFLAAKISFVNELANLCEKCSVDITDVTQGMGLDNRIGPHFLKPGPGFGGSCFPKDVKALLALSEKYGCKSLMLQSILEVNEVQKRRMADKIERAPGKLAGCRIAVLGLSFKPGTDDIRESPAVSVISALLERNAAVAVYDPKAMENMKREHPEMKLEYCSDIYSACSRSDCIVLATEWKEFSDLDFMKLKSIVRRPVFMDLRNEYRPEYVKSFGFCYEGVGRK